MLHSVPAGVVSAAYSSASSFTVGAATFDGGDELQRSAPGVFSSDGKEFAIAFWFNLADEDDQTHVIFSSRTSSSNRFLLQRSASGGDQDNNFALVGRNTSNSQVVYIESLAGSNGYDSTSRNTGWNHFLCSGNLATSAFHMYVNGSSVLDTGATVVVNDNIDFTGLFHVGRIGSDSTAFYGEMAEFWLDDSFIDFSSSTNREKFYSSGGAAVDLGSDGSTPTGSAPLVYLHLDSGETGNNFASNAGTGGDLTVTAGALVNAGGLTTIETVRRSTVYTWNSTISTTAQTIANQEASPADGSDQTDYDIMNGSSTGSDTRDVTYVSSSGGEYYKPASNTALDFLTMHTFKSLTAFTNSLHKEDAAFTIEMGFGAPNPPPTSNIGYFASTAEDTGDVGISVKYDNNNKIVFAVSNGSGSSLALSQTSTNAAASGFNHVVISINEGVTNGSIIYLNNSTSDTFSANYSSPSTSAATYNWHFLTSLQAPPGDLSTPRFAVGTNSGIGYFAVYNKAVSAEEAGILYDNAPSRFKV